MNAQACTQNVSAINKTTQFKITNAIYTSGIFGKVKLKPTSKMVLIGLSMHYNPKKPDMFPSKEYMAKHLGINEKSVFNAIQELRAKGLIVYEAKTVNRYKFTSVFFGLINFADEPCKKDSNNHANFACKPIKEHKNNNGFSNFQNNVPSEESLRQSEKRISETKELINKTYENKRTSPMDDLETAKIWLNSLGSEQLKHEFIKMRADKVKQKWNL